jgi:DNA-binding CsgD family transcriptional regulator
VNTEKTVAAASADATITRDKMTTNYETTEEWRAVAEFPNYEVSNYGRVRRVNMKYRLPKILRQKIHKQGYKEIGLCDFQSVPSRKHTRLVHRLVAQAFIPGAKEEVNHLNGNKADNRVENLSWATPQENVHHANYHGLNHKLSATEVREIRRLKQEENMMQKEIAKKFGLAPHTISQIVHGQRWSWLK